MSAPLNSGSKNSSAMAGWVDQGAGEIWSLLETIAAYKWWIAAVFVISCAIGGLYAMYATPIYLADALIQIEDRKGAEGIGQASVSAFGLGVAPPPIAGEIEIIKSREVLDQAIHQLKRDISIVVVNKRVPYYAARFERSVGGSGLELAQPKFGMNDWAWGGEALDVDLFEVPDFFQGHGFLLEILDQRTWRLWDGERIVARGGWGDTVSFQLNQHVARIRVKSFLARTGTRFRIIKQSEARAYTNLLANLKVLEVSRPSGVVRVSFEDAERAHAIQVVNQIASAYLIQNVTRRLEEVERSLAFLDQQLPKFKQDLEKAENELNRYRLQTKSIDLGKEADALLQRSVDIQKARVDIQMRRQLLSQRFLPGHPEMRALDAQLEELNRQEGLLLGLVRRLPETQQTFLHLQRDVAVNIELYTTLLNNAQQLRIAKAGTVGNVRVIDFASADDFPIRPQRTLILGVSAVVGLFLGVVLAFVARTLRSTIQNAAEIENQLGLTVCATIPESRQQEKIAKSQRLLTRQHQRQLLYEVKPDDIAIEALRSLRVALQFAMVGASNKNILFTGPAVGIGKSFLAANLAAILVEAGKRVLLIDTDLRRPRINNYFNLLGAPGLSEYLLGQKSFAQVVQTGTPAGVRVICAGAKVSNPGELLLHGRLQELLDSQQQNFDFILLDAPPILPVSDALITGKLAATVFLVLRAEQSSLRHAAEALRRMSGAGVAPKGAIFNGVPAHGFGYYRYEYNDQRR